MKDEPIIAPTRRIARSGFRQVGKIEELPCPAPSEDCGPMPINPNVRGACARITSADVASAILDEPDHPKPQRRTFMRLNGRRGVRTFFTCRQRPEWGALSVKDMAARSDISKGGIHHSVSHNVSVRGLNFEPAVVDDVVDLDEEDAA